MHQIPTERQQMHQRYLAYRMLQQHLRDHGGGDTLGGGDVQGASVADCSGREPSKPLSVSSVSEKAPARPCISEAALCWSAPCPPHSPATGVSHAQAPSSCGYGASEMCLHDSQLLRAGGEIPGTLKSCDLILASSKAQIGPSKPLGEVLCAVRGTNGGQCRVTDEKGSSEDKRSGDHEPNVCTEIPNSSNPRISRHSTLSASGHRALYSHSISEVEGEPKFRIFRLSTVKGGATGGFLDGVSSRAKCDLDALVTSSASSAWYTSEPFRAMASRRHYQLFHLVASAFHIYIVSILVGSIFITGSFHTTAVRFVLLQSRDGTTPLPNSSLISSFGLLREGCKLPDVAITTKGPADDPPATVILRFNSTVVADGYYFTTLKNGLGSKDPVRWQVYAAAVGTEGDVWLPVGASVWRLSPRGDGILDLYPWMSYPTPEGRGVEVKVNHREGWEWTLIDVLVTLNVAVGTAVVALSGMAGHPQWAKPVWIWMFVFPILQSLAVGPMLLESGRTREAAFQMVFLLPHIWFIVGVLLAERRSLYIILGYGLLGVGAQCAQDLVIYEGSEVNWFISALVALVLCFTVISGRQRDLWRAKQLIKPDRRRYDDIWAALMHQEGTKEGLNAVCNQVVAIRLACSSNPQAAPVQLVPVQSVRGSQDAGQSSALFGCNLTLYGFTTARNVYGMRRADCLDQLFVQAHCLQPMLVAKAQDWALASGGRVSVQVGYEGVVKYERYDELLATGRQLEINWCRVKSAQRAVEKVARAYQADPSRLLDLCRQSLVFDHPTGVAACLEVLASDPEVSILRIKNRLDPGYDSSSSAGYRDVGINLRLNNAEARAQGLHLHVCELQLILMAFAAVKTQAGHKHYVHCRNLRGE